MMFKKISKTILIVLVLLIKPTETANGCDPGESWEIFMTGSRFAIGEIVDIDGLDILLDVADYFIIGRTIETEKIDSERHNDNNQSRTENFNIANSQSRIENFDQGDYVIVSFGGEDMVGRGFCDTSGTEIFPITSLDNETLHVKHRQEHISKMLTDFVYHRGTYTYETWSRGTRIYRQHRSNPEGWLLIYDLNSLILGNITVLEEEKLTIEIWDYVTSDGEALAFELVTFYWEDHHRRSFEDFNVGDTVALTVQLPTQLSAKDEDARVLATIEISDVFFIDIIDYDIVLLEHVQENSGLSALYTDFLQHRGYYSYVVTFGSLLRYESIERLEGEGLIMVYQQGMVVSEPVDLTVETESENLTIRESSSSGATLVFTTVGIGGVFGVVVAFLVVKIRK